MIRTVGIGHQDFETIRKNDLFYIDKTDFIREWWDNQDEVTLITRPRRFGKTLNMSMTEQFFSVEYAQRMELFEDLSIWQHEKYRRLQGTYPVISLSFADVKETDFRDAKEKICQLISMLYEKYRFLLEGDFLSEQEKDFFNGVSAEMPNYAATLSLKMLSGFLSRYYGKKVIILLDEYDTPMQEAFVNGYWDEMASFTRSLFNAAFKTNPYLERAILTGITRISKESVFSDLNNLEVVTTTTEKYETAFGFTEDEVFAALEEFGLSDCKQTVKNWYDGFSFGRIQDIYNPWSVINYLKKGKVGTYWANTSSNSLVGKLIREAGTAIKNEFEQLLRGGILNMAIDEQIVFSQLSENENALWSLLLASGYLKVVDYCISENTGEERYQLSLTNKEVQIMFDSMVRNWFAGSSQEYNGFIRALLQDDLDAMNEYMNKIALRTFSYFDVSGKDPERFYHGFILGLIVDLAGRYNITSNRESGFGRYDVMLEPLQAEDPGLILEFKVFRPKYEKSLEDTVCSALEQINSKNYISTLESRGLPASRIRKYGFAFDGKKVLIGSDMRSGINENEKL